MPLTMLNAGQAAQILEIHGSPAVRVRLADLGLTVGSDLRVISRNGGSVLVGVRESRLMIQQGLAHQIEVG
ncbi:FeoA family protein [Azotosporobacter soli]|uniref:FeoA family protein n=1 Tax=Azotosporobacter soli TaxID=3055040 RepID=UPI0031FED245